MTNKEYIGHIEQVIQEHQKIQMDNPHNSDMWQRPSQEINRLAKIIVVEKAIR